MQDCDICVIGGGVIGLAVALELERRGARVTVVERGKLLSEASQAAAGMLAAEDPDNPAELIDLARLSIERYGQFLSGIEQLSELSVPFQTSVTYQAIEPNPDLIAPRLPLGIVPEKKSFLRLLEHSIDPRQLASALRDAVAATSVQVLEDTPAHMSRESSSGVIIQAAKGEIHAERIVFAQGAWSADPVRPRKGQMLAVRMPKGSEIDYVVRTPEIYIVPRLHGPRAGHVVIGATVEDAGFSKTTDVESLAALRAKAAKLLPAIADAFTVEQWAGLRPHTPDHLPLIGWAGESRRVLIATGHYRNGILLAPGTAAVVASLLAGHETGVDLAAFSPSRFD